MIPYSKNFSKNTQIFVKHEKQGLEIEITANRLFWYMNIFLECNIHSILTYFNDSFNILEISI